MGRDYMIPSLTAAERTRYDQFYDVSIKDWI